MPRIRGMRTYDMMLWVAILAVPLAAVSYLVKAASSAREAARRSQCKGNLACIGLALRNYDSTYGCFPPAHTIDETGRPMHSWRVLIMPFIDNDLIKHYSFDEPWDSPSNRTLLTNRINVWKCPSDPSTNATPGMTNYVVVRGNETLFPGSRSITLNDVDADGRAETLMVVEVTGLAIPWTAPYDLDFATMSFQLNDPARPSISSHHPGGANIHNMNGSCEFLRDSTTPEQLRARLTIPAKSR